MAKQEAEKHRCKLSNPQTSQCQEAEKHPRVIAAQCAFTEEVCSSQVAASSAFKCRNKKLKSILVTLSQTKVGEHRFGLAALFQTKTSGGSTSSGSGCRCQSCYLHAGQRQVAKCTPLQIGYANAAIASSTSGAAVSLAASSFPKYS